MNLLVCGSRRSKDYKVKVFDALDKFQNDLRLHNISSELVIIHGACPNSADVYAEEWAQKNSIITKKFPAWDKYLLRNIEMVKEADSVLAFWDEFSYGTAHTLAHAALKGIGVKVYAI